MPVAASAWMPACSGRRRTGCGHPLLGRLCRRPSGRTWLRQWRLRLRPRLRRRLLRWPRLLPTPAPDACSCTCFGCTGVSRSAPTTAPLDRYIHQHDSGDRFTDGGRTRTYCGDLRDRHQKEHDECRLGEDKRHVIQGRSYRTVCRRSSAAPAVYRCARYEGAHGIPAELEVDYFSIWAGSFRWSYKLGSEINIPLLAGQTDRAPYCQGRFGTPTAS